MAGSWGCVARRTIVSALPTRTAPNDSANFTTRSTRMRSWTCARSSCKRLSKTLRLSIGQSQTIDARVAASAHDDV